ncbi:MAG: hypothetical protein P1U56_05495 [Saprospiraceae bacterium]|nr:hypothetical protein [Saprospiraceae bacterium]
MTGSKIYKHIPTVDDQDYDYLRAEGIEYIKKMAGNVWTDHNLHDPGITILEVLCYAITDLGYRISAPIEDLLTYEEDSLTKLAKSFPTAKQILTTKPITENDYRKLFININDVKNAFIKAYKDDTVYMHCSTKDEVSKDHRKGVLSYEPELDDYARQHSFNLKGLNKIFFVPDISISQEKNEILKNKKIDALKEKIKEEYHANRNLCEDLVEVCVAEEYEINVCGDIEIEKTADAKEVVADVLFNIQEFLSPSIKRYSLEQLIDQGKTPEEIFNGPVLSKGFITDEELEKANFRTEIRLSDLIQIISETKGVQRIKKVLMRPCPCNKPNDEAPCAELINPWKICLPEDFNKVIVVCLNSSIINAFKDIIPIDIDQSEVENLVIEKLKKFNASNEFPYDDFDIPSGNYLNSGAYYSFQNDLPNIYGVDEIGLSSQLPNKRHAQVLQLKGFLSFFDQVLATYFSHLKHVGDLLSLDVSASNTYYANDLSDIKHFKDKLVKDTVSFDLQTQEYLNELDDYIDRKGVFLDHLLARFAENMNDYVFLMIDLFGVETKDASLIHKSKFLEEYPALGYKRGCAFNYYDKTKGVWDTENVSGLQHRLARLLGFRDFKRRDLTSFNYEIYPEVDDDPTDEWRWRIKNKAGVIMFSSSMHYDSIEAAEDELWKTISLAWDENNYDLLPTEDEEQWYFNLIDKSKEVVARHIQYYNDKSEAEATIKAYAKFIYENVTDEGMYLFENILLRPDRKNDLSATSKFIKICVDNDCTQCKPHDPYSFRLTIVLPGWTKRFSNTYFREFAEGVIREEVPAHIMTRICWIGYPASNEGEEPSQMEKLETIYKAWLTKKMESPLDQSSNDKLEPLVDLLHDLSTIYPTGRLHDCNTEGSAFSPIILNQSSLGDIKIKEDGNT